LMTTLALTALDCGVAFGFGGALGLGALALAVFVFFSTGASFSVVSGLLRFLEVAVVGSVESSTGTAFFAADFLAGVFAAAFGFGSDGVAVEVFVVDFFVTVLVAGSLASDAALVEAWVALGAALVEALVALGAALVVDAAALVAGCFVVVVLAVAVFVGFAVPAAFLGGIVKKVIKRDP
jgi:hypothetical protein